MHIRQKLYEAFMANNVETINILFVESPKLKNRRISLEGDWLYFAARYCNLDVINYLIGIGFDPHAKAKLEGDNPLCAAVSARKIENVKFFLNLGVEMDTSAVFRNPLFTAVSRGDMDITRLLLEAGIDATVAYHTPAYNGMEAACFAVYNNSPECAKLIVEHLSKDDSKKYKQLWIEAKKVRKKLR